MTKRRARTPAEPWRAAVLSCTFGPRVVSTRYLSLEERHKALAIPRALQTAEKEFQSGIRQTNRLIATMQNILLPQHLLIDYVAVVDPVTLKNIEVIKGRAVLAIAARVGTTRLIDNLIVEEGRL